MGLRRTRYQASKATEMMPWPTSARTWTATPGIGPGSRLRLRATALGVGLHDLAREAFLLHIVRRRGSTRALDPLRSITFQDLSTALGCVPLGPAS